MIIKVANNKVIDENSLFYSEEGQQYPIQEIPVTQDIYEAYKIDIRKVIYQDGAIILNPNYEQEQAQKEASRILELSMTRSDFFDGTIMAFGADSTDLLTAINNVLSISQISAVEKKIALNNYENALNFYRKHPLFTILSNVPIQLSSELSVTITSTQWDKFFDETDKGNTEAYKYLTSVTCTINPTPSDATVVINNETRNTIVAPYGTDISYTVSKEGYATQSGTLNLTEYKYLSIELLPLDIV